MINVINLLKRKLFFSNFSHTGTNTNILQSFLILLWVIEMWIQHDSCFGTRSNYFSRSNFLRPISAQKVSAFGVILVRIFPHSDWIRIPYSVQMRENKDQNNSEYGHFSRSAHDFKHNGDLSTQEDYFSLSIILTDIWLHFHEEKGFSFAMY